MTIIHLPEERDDARDNAIEAREWQAQERATRAERLQPIARGPYPSGMQPAMKGHRPR